MQVQYLPNVTESLLNSHTGITKKCFRIVFSAPGVEGVGTWNMSWLQATKDKQLKQDICIAGVLPGTITTIRYNGWKWPHPMGNLRHSKKTARKKKIPSCVSVFAQH